MSTTSTNSQNTLRDSLAYEPQILKFGTSGRRGEVIHLTQLEIYLNAAAELEYLLSLPATDGGIRKGDDFYIAYDLRPSSTRISAEQGNRGELAQAIVQAITDAGLKPINLGPLPTPALTYYALVQGKGSMMITGSHIPFERNGYKTNSAQGELLKKDEDPINQRVEQVRQRLYSQPADKSLFNPQGMFKIGPRPLPPETPVARDAYLRRYTDFFGPSALAGLRLLAYQHSAVGRDLLVELLQKLGATVTPAGRSDTFVPIDTEAIDAAQLGVVQQLVDQHWKTAGPFDAVVSTDGDSDRPLILGIEHTQQGGKVRFFGGDLVGMIVAEFLGADAVVVPISCNDALDRGALKDMVEPKTRIGSPMVIAGMNAARAKGRRVVCGWEANGGFLTGSDITRNGKTLRALPTRDALLPILSVLSSAKQQGTSVVQLFERLPRRFSKAALLRKFPRPTALKIVEKFSPAEPVIKDVFFDNGDVRLADDAGRPITPAPSRIAPLQQIRQTLSTFFTPNCGFDAITRLNYIDGVRIYFANGDVAHVRPSGNADELRIYAVADTQARADAIAAHGVGEPDGILRRLEKSVA